MNITSDRRVYGNHPFVVPYGSEEILMILAPNETRIYHGFCTLILKVGTLTLSNPIPGDRPHIKKIGFSNKLFFISQSFLRIKGGKRGGTFTLKRIHLN